MQFKESSFIFVTGFVLFVIGGFMNAFGISGSITSSLARSIYSSDSNGGYVALTLFGSTLALIGLIQMCMGAYRALAKIDALPVPIPPEPEATPASPVEPAEAVVTLTQPQSYSPPQTPKHMIYNESGSEGQPPVQ